METIKSAVTGAMSYTGMGENAPESSEERVGSSDLTTPPGNEETTTAHESTTAPATSDDKTEPPAEGDDKNQSTAQGADPNLVGSAETGKVKMVGTGAPGSHSALFGLVPDGKSKSSSSDEDESKSKDKDTEDLGSRGVSGGEVAEQMHDPRVGERATED